MSAVRRTLLTLLPKVLLSRLTGVLTHTPLPAALRGPALRAFARRYGASLAEVEGELRDYRSLWHFFQRSLRPGARPLGQAKLLWPNDGKVVTAGPVQGGMIPQVKGSDYRVDELVGDAALAQELDGGSQATVYLAPGDYHRVHAPFAAEVLAVRALPGTLFPVNPPAVRAVPRLFVRNARHVFSCRLPDGRAGAVVMVGALNVGDTRVSVQAPCRVQGGHELGRFGFGSTTVVLLGPGGFGFGETAPETVVRMGQDAIA